MSPNDKLQQSVSFLNCPFYSCFSKHAWAKQPVQGTCTGFFIYLLEGQIAFMAITS